MHAQKLANVNFKRLDNSRLAYQDRTVYPRTQIFPECRMPVPVPIQVADPQSLNELSSGRLVFDC